MKIKNILFVIIPFFSFGQDNLSTIVNPKMASSIDFKRIKKPNDKALTNTDLIGDIIKYEEINKVPFFTGVPNFYYNYEIVKKKISSEKFIIEMLDTRNGDLYDLSNLITFPNDMYYESFGKDIFFMRKKLSLKWNEEEKKFILSQIGKTVISSNISPKLISDLKKKYKTNFNEGEGGFLQVQGDNIVLKVNKKEMLFDINGKELSKPIYDEIYSYYAPYVYVRNGKLNGILDNEGKTIFPVKYNSMLVGIGGGLFTTQENNGYKIINLKGEDFKKDIFNSVGQFNSGLLRVQVGDKCGYFDINGDAIVPKIYQYCQDFSEDIASVSRNGKCGYINMYGTEIIPITSFDNCSSFEDGLAEIIIKNRRGLIDKTGKILVLPIYDLLQILNNDYIKVIKNNKCGLVDRHGDIVIPIKYDDIQKTQKKDLFIAKLGDKLGAIDQKGNVIAPFEYNYFDPGLGSLLQEDSNHKIIKRFEVNF